MVQGENNSSLLYPWVTVHTCKCVHAHTVQKYINTFLKSIYVLTPGLGLLGFSKKAFVGDFLPRSSLFQCLPPFQNAPQGYPNSSLSVQPWSRMLSRYCGSSTLLPHTRSQSTMAATMSVVYDCIQSPKHDTQHGNSQLCWMDAPNVYWLEIHSGKTMFILQTTTCQNFK